MISYASRCTSSIAARHQPALLLDYARSREVPDATLLHGAGIAAGALEHSTGLISPAQYLHLLRNLSTALGAADTSFMLGQQLLPGHFGAASHALLQAPDLKHALDTLTQQATLLCPLMRPRLRHEGSLAVLYFTDSHGAGALRGLVAEMHMTAVVSMSRWLSAQRLPWRFCFNRTRPHRIAQHEVHLGSELRFDCHLDAMLIDAHWLDVPWPRGNATAAALARRETATQAAPAPSLPDTLYDYLLARIRTGPSLEQTACEFGISLATLKRHLAQHGSHYQSELDQVRTHVALHLFHTRGYDNEQVADYLGFHDATNFRRSFKRWTGLTPRSLRASLSPLGI